MVNRISDEHYPSCSSSNELANLFADFFEDKIKLIREGLVGNSFTECVNTSLTNRLTTFREISLNDLSKLISSMVSKSCDLDPLPSKILKGCFNLLLPTIVSIVNMSLNSGVMPTQLKKAMIRPILKKPTLPTDEFTSFRPISNLKFLSKVIEKVVAVQLIEHLENNELHEKFQSAYKRHHSVETALVRVYNDILRAIDNHCSVILVLLDLSAAFDTVDHSLLLQRLSVRYGINGLAHQWFRSYLSDRHCTVRVQEGQSTLRNV